MVAVAVEGVKQSLIHNSGMSQGVRTVGTILGIRAIIENEYGSRVTIQYVYRYVEGESRAGEMEVTSGQKDLNYLLHTKPGNQVIVYYNPGQDRSVIGEEVFPKG